MENHGEQKLPLSAFWYAVAFIGGLYYGITFASGGISRTFALLLPPILCLFMAVVATSGVGRRTVLGAITLYINYALSFAIGYGSSRAGVIKFLYHK
jgi:hypothetical protein